MNPQHVLPIAALALVACEPPLVPDCTSPCGLAIFGPAKCEQVASLENAALTALELHAGYPRDEVCAGFSGRIVRVVGTEIFTDAWGRKSGGLTFGPEGYTVVGLFERNVRAVPHELTHAAQWTMEKREVHSCGPKGEWTDTGLTAAVDHAMSQ